MDKCAEPTFENHQELLQRLEENSLLLFPWQNMWPNYPSSEIFSKDREFTLRNQTWLT